MGVLGGFVLWTRLLYNGQRFESNLLSEAMNTKHYLCRLQFSGSTEPTLPLLQTLQKQHLLNIPFENWHIHDGIPITLDSQSLFAKIVEQQRGGFCYELNGLFYELLKELGFAARLVSARVYAASTDSYGAEFDHMAIVVALAEQEYLVDVGFGEFALQPLTITPDRVQHDKRGDFLLQQHDDNYIVYKKSDEKFLPEYKFDRCARSIDDFSEMCHYHQTSPQSHFTQKRLLSLATENGRLTLSGNDLTIREGNQTTEILLSGDVDSIIEKYFYPFPSVIK